jgi:uncharacterized glyoxalase superfamily protein PhnB
MRDNRSMPRSTVIPTLAYPDVATAVRWLCETFGFTERLRIGNHRAQLNVGDGAMVVTQAAASGAGPQHEGTHSVMVRVENVDRHYTQAMAKGANILEAPTDFPYGERQYTAEDIGGHRWTFSQSVADVDPAEWGGTLVNS